MDKLKQRHSEILKALSIHGRMDVNELSRKCKVSLVTIRKDLTQLEERGLLKREQGCAMISEKDNITRRMASNYGIKCQIAKEAAALVQHGDTIMIESGSCCILLADEICRTKHDVMIVTNSVFMTDYIGKHSDTHIVLLGGDYQADSQAVVGPITRMCAKTFHVKRFFVGVDGYIPGIGFTGDNHLRVETLHNMAASADAVTVITESDKFSRQGIVALFSLAEVQSVITDNYIPDHIKAELLQQHIAVSTVS